MYYQIHKTDVNNPATLRSFQLSDARRATKRRRLQLVMLCHFPRKKEEKRVLQNSAFSCHKSLPNAY